MKKLLWVLPWVTMVLTAADISGVWSGTIEVQDEGGSTVETPVRVEFVQKSDTLSGKIGRQGNEEEGQIRNGKVEGKKVSFEVASIETGSPMKFNLTLENDRLEGEMKGSVDASEITGKVKLSREKPHAHSTP